MAEENIYIGKQIPNPCQKCRKEVCENGCKKYDKYYDDFQKSKTYLYSRAEAIERMAKALCLCDDDGGCKGVCNPKCDVWKYSIPHAEAALNALLGEK